MSERSVSHGVGILTWEGEERRSKRYGSFHLISTNYEQTVRESSRLDIPSVLVGKRVRAVLRVLESRRSGHVGDMFLDIQPSQPEVGEVVMLGPGILSVQDVCQMESPGVFLSPEDGRSELWLDPRLLYRLHDQTVELFLEETDEVAEPVVLPSADPGVIAVGNGTFQVSGVPLPTQVFPRMERVAGAVDTFIADLKFRQGERVQTS